MMKMMMMMMDQNRRDALNCVGRDSHSPVVEENNFQQRATKPRGH